MLPLIRLRRLARDRRGLAALEFALIAPMLVIVLFGSVELNELLACNRRTENVTAAIVDVVSRDSSVTNQEMDDLWTAANALMYPSSATPLMMRVSSIQVVNATQAKVLWSDGHNGYTPLAVNSAVTLPAEMMVVGTTVIVAETSYHYTPPIGVFLKLASDLAHKEYRRPRVVDPIPRV